MYVCMHVCTRASRVQLHIMYHQSRLAYKDIRIKNGDYHLDLKKLTQKNLNTAKKRFVRACVRVRVCVCVCVCVCGAPNDFYVCASLVEKCAASLCRRQSGMITRVSLEPSQTG